MKSASKFAGLLTVVLFFATLVRAATVTGSVKSPDGTPFRGAFVQAQNTGTRVLVSVLTDKDGRYRIENLPAGKYQVQVKAVGYRTDPRTDVSLTAEQNASYDFALQQGMVRWSDLSQYQGEVLFPDAKGKDLLVGRCFACHGFQSRMASARRDEEGWRDRVDYMKESMHFFLGGVGSPFNDRECGGRGFVHQFAVRRGICFAEISDRDAEVQGTGPDFQRRCDEDCLRRIRIAGPEPHAVERVPGQRRQLLDAVLRQCEQDRQAGSENGRSAGVSGAESGHGRDSLRGARSRTAASG